MELAYQVAGIKHGTDRTATCRHRQQCHINLSIAAALTTIRVFEPIYGQVQSRLETSETSWKQVPL